MAGFYQYPIAKNVSHPKQVFSELRFTHPGKTDPKPVFVKRQQAATPAQQRFLSIDCLQVNHILHLERVPANTHDMPVYRREINVVAANQTVMSPLHCVVNALTSLR